jgi:hypothetical protein
VGVPQAGAAYEALEVGADRDVARQALNVHVLGIAAADIQPIVVKLGFQGPVMLDEPPIPALFAYLLQLLRAHTIQAGFDIRNKCAVRKQGGADPGA